MFPQSDKSVDIVDALVSYCKKSGAKIIHAKAKNFELNENRIISVVLDDKTKIPAILSPFVPGAKVIR